MIGSKPAIILAGLALLQSTIAARIPLGRRQATTTTAAAAASSSVAPLTCPSADGTVYHNYTIYCTTDFYGGDMRSASAATLNICGKYHLHFHLPQYADISHS